MNTANVVLKAAVMPEWQKPFEAEYSTGAYFGVHRMSRPTSVPIGGKPTLGGGKSNDGLTDRV